MAFLVSVSFHDGSGSPAAAVWAVAERGTSVDKAGSAAKAESSARRLTVAKEAFELIDGPFQEDQMRKPRAEASAEEKWKNGRHKLSAFRH